MEFFGQHHLIDLCANKRLLSKWQTEVNLVTLTYSMYVDGLMRLSSSSYEVRGDLGGLDPKLGFGPQVGNTVLEALLLFRGEDVGSVHHVLRTASGLPEDGGCTASSSPPHFT